MTFPNPSICVGQTEYTKAVDVHLPPGFWEEYRKRIEPDLAQLRHDLFPL